jgi:hypothetical protein
MRPVSCVARIGGIVLFACTPQSFDGLGEACESNSDCVEPLECHGGAFEILANTCQLACSTGSDCPHQGFCGCDSGICLPDDVCK